jgi:hypothetical protein
VTLSQLAVSNPFVFDWRGLSETKGLQWALVADRSTPLFLNGTCQSETKGDSVALQRLFQPTCQPLLFLTSSATSKTKVAPVTSFK